ncbi:MAG: type II toxin-antitoxin system RelE/ParE family toxin [Bacteroidota bacterium]
MKQPEKYMKNTYKIIWTDEAYKNLQYIVNYLEEFWTSREIRKFAKLLDKQLILITKNPSLYPYSNKAGQIRKSVLTKQITLYYKVTGIEIYLITLFDSRQSPDKLKLD